MSLSLAFAFTDQMVLQQQRPVPVWGKAPAKKQVQVAFAGQRKSCTADAYGQWILTLDPLAVCSEGRALTVTCADESVTLNEVLVGEVWICSGQSNMQWAVSQMNNADEEIARANHPLIRLLQIPNIPADLPVSEVKTEGWKVCTPESATGFSAVGYCFGRELSHRLGIPVGLIASSWGGTVAEAWTSQQTLNAHPELKPLVDTYLRDASRIDELHQEWTAACEKLAEATRDTGNSGFAKGWADPAIDVGNWPTMSLPGNWAINHENINGVIWHRREVKLPAAWAGKAVTLSVGACDKSETTYFNNVRVGGLSMDDDPKAWNTPRVYEVPAELVKAGANTVAVRVHSDKLQGGMTGPPELMTVALTDKPDETVSLVGTWRYQIEQNYGLVQIPAMPAGADSPNRPSVLYNGMIWPLVPMAIRGAIWYQGESNAARAKQYRTLFPEMIRDWRRTWGYDFPFYFVQLANYMAVQPEPTDTNWAQLREAQNVALELPDTGVAVAIDIGEAGDIHPRNKQDVGLRLALNALAITYGQQIEYSGPVYESHDTTGNTLTVTFSHADGMHARDGAVTGFAIAGADGVFHWASGTISGKRIALSSDAVPAPVHVRYAWADNPIANLYNGANLPASPFRSDCP